jgi:hypothetical protein
MNTYHIGQPDHFSAKKKFYWSAAENLLVAHVKAIFDMVKIFNFSFKKHGVQIIISVHAPHRSIINRNPCRL